MKRNGAGVLSSKATMDSKTLPDSTTCTFLAEGNGSGLKGKINLYNKYFCCRNSHLTPCSMKL